MEPNTGFGQPIRDLHGGPSGPADALYETEQAGEVFEVQPLLYVRTSQLAAHSLLNDDVIGDFTHPPSYVLFKRIPR